MAFQEFSKNYLGILVVPRFQHFLKHHFLFYQLYWRLVSSLAGKSITLLSHLKPVDLYSIAITSRCLQIIFSIFYQTIYMFITTWISSPLSICVLLFSLMQSVNGAQLLNTTSLFLLFRLLLFQCFGAIIVSLTTMYASP